MFVGVPPVVIGGGVAGPAEGVGVVSKAVAVAFWACCCAVAYLVELAVGK